MESTYLSNDSDEFERLGTKVRDLKLGGVHVFSFVRYGDSILVPEGLTARVLRTLPDGMASLSMSGRVRAANERLDVAPPHVR